MAPFITEYPYLATKRHKDDAKKHARDNNIAYNKALDEVTRTRFSSTHKSKSWGAFQRHNTAELHPSGIITTRLANDLPLEIQLVGFRQDLSDFTVEAALTKVEISASASGNDGPDFRIVSKVEKASSFKSADQPLARFFDAAKNEAAPRERLGPVVKSIKADVLQMLTRWETWTPESVRLSQKSDADAARYAAEVTIADVLKVHGPTATVWASRAALAALPAVPTAWLMLLKFGAQHPKNEFKRIVECGIAACDLAYGSDSDDPQIGDPGIVTATDTFMELKQFAAAPCHVIDNADLAETTLVR